MIGLFETFFSQPVLGIVLILIGFIFSFLAGQNKAYHFYKKNKKNRILPKIIVIMQYIFIILGVIFIIVLNYKNPNWGSDVSIIISTFLIFGFFIVITFLIYFLTHKLYKRKYLEEERRNKLIEEINLIMAEFGGNKTDTALDEPDMELNKEDEEFLLFLKNKYMKEDK